MDLGIPSEDLDAILGIAEMTATLDDNLIVYVQGPALQKWSST